MMTRAEKLFNIRAQVQKATAMMPILKTWPQIQQWLKGLFKR